MAKRRIFYSFHFENDVMRVQQIRNIGALEDNEPVSVNKWEEIKREGDDSIENWIRDTMSGCSCLVVLVGEETAQRHWVQYEIQHAWEQGKGVLGIYINNIKDLKYGKGYRGENPFKNFVLDDEGNLLKRGSFSYFFNWPFEDSRYLSRIVRCYVPKSKDAYNDIKDNLELWIEKAIKKRNRYPK
ncbi:MAG: TIR domain-containing protein [Candidatus Dadabacteria bacterium]|nr:TIR domain-containing protein [Candidatus Dadabacteria bacterium]